MKNLFSILALKTVVILSLQAQPVSNYSYKLDNGITVKTEHCWNQVWVQQSYEAMNAGGQTPPLAVNIRTLGDLISSSAFKLLSAGKEVKLQGAAPGTYDLKLTFKLSGKPGTYDVLISIGISGQTHKVWLENFLMKPDVNYKIATNLNAGVIIYTGGNKEVKVMHLYPAGTAARQTGSPAPIKNLETISYESLALTNACPPGAYDVLINFGKGVKYEWRKDIVVKTGAKTEVK